MNMDTIELVDETPPEKPKPKKRDDPEPPKPKPKMKADSVLSMAKMFQAGQAPGANLTELQERSMLQKRKQGSGGGSGGGRAARPGDTFDNPLASGRVSSV